MNVYIDGSAQELLGLFEGAAVGQIFGHRCKYGFRSQIVNAQNDRSTL
jgi:hypothetical protein